jgi:hypothetical protein
MFFSIAVIFIVLFFDFVIGEFVEVAEVAVQLVRIER